MKKLFYVIFTFIALSLLAQISQPRPVNQDYSVRFAGQNGYRVTGDNIYAVYLEGNYVTFAFSGNNSYTFTEFEIAESYLSRVGFNTEPVLELLSDGTVVILYLTKITEDDVVHYYLNKAVGTSEGNFELEVLEDNVYETPQITNSNDVLTIFYKTGFSKNLTHFEHFTNVEESENADYSQESAVTKFWGPDVFNGPVHSNDDIWIQNGGGGDNDGWPTFNGFVTTSGIFQHYNQGGGPLSQDIKEQIFLGEPSPGYAENVPQIEEFDATSVQENSIHPFDDVDIAYVKMEGGSFISKVANIELVGIEEFEVYSWYPTDTGIANSVVDSGGNWFEDSDNIWTNHIAIYDTIWSEGPTGVISDYSFFVDCELWIEGVVSGSVTFASSDTIYIVGDITYANTNIGENPDNPDNLNTTDYFGLISEEKILIKYKHRDPFDDMALRDDNCDGINLYGSYAAVGQGNVDLYGEQNCHYEGIFSFEYQHPHGSTPDFNAESPYNGQDTLYSYIDFHKFIYPIYATIPPDYNSFRLHSNNPDPGSGLVCGYPIEGAGFPDPNGYNASYPNNAPFAAFPYGTDYPWYNPVWPESSEDIVGERGTINLWGSMAQTRRGYTHRSGQDPYNHGTYHSDSDRDCPECLYDLENFLFGGSHRINGGGIGYEKNFHYDSRLKETSPPNFAYAYSGEQVIKVLRSVDLGESFTEVYNEEVHYNNDILYSDSENGNVAHYYGNEYDLYKLFSEDNGQTYQLLELHPQDAVLSDIQNIKISADDSFLHFRTIDFFQGYWSATENIYLNENNIASFETENIYSFSDFDITNSNEKVLLQTYEFDDEEEPGFYYTSGSNEFDTFMYWEPEFVSEDLNINKTKINMQFNEADSIYIMLFKVTGEESQAGDLYIYRGRLDGITVNAEDEVPVAGFSLSLFPNPFNPSVTISFNVSRKDAKDAKINIYNIKGQKVKSFSINSHPELVEGSVIWNGKDENGKRVSSGTYFIKLSDGKDEIIKKAVLIK